MSKKIREKQKRNNPDLAANYSFSNTSELIDALSELPTNTGTLVTPFTAQTSSAVFCAVNNLAWSVASLPKTIVYQDGKVRKEAPEYYLHDILSHEPNPEISSFTFFELIMRHLLLRGNFYAQINFDRNGFVQELWALHPDYVRVRRDLNTGNIFYDYQSVAGQQTLPSSRILHIKSFSENGLVGLSVIQMARQAIGYAISADEFGERFFKNNSKPSGYWTIPVGMKLDDIKKYKADIEAINGGNFNAHKTSVVEKGFDFNPISISQKDSQFLETRQFQVAEIARIFNLPPHILGLMEKSSYNTLEQENKNYIIRSLSPWLVRIKQEINRTLISKADRKNYHFEFNLTELEMGDMKTQFECFNTARNGGWMSTNEIRSKMHLSPIPGGDIYLMPLNMTSLESFEKEQSAPEPVETVAQIPQEAPTNGQQEQNSASGAPETREAVKEAPDADPDGETRGRPKDYAKRAKRRLALRNHFKPLVKDAAVRCVKREVQDVKVVVNKHFNYRSESEFNKELSACYDKLGDHFRTVLQPILKTYFTQLAEAAAEELGVEDYQIDIDQLVSQYLDAFIARHNGSAQGQLNQLANNEDGLDPLVLIEQRLDEWMDKSPDKIENNETVQAEGYLFKMLALACGVTKLRWNASATACPLCQEMNGKVCGIEENFADKGDTVDGKEDQSMDCYSSVSNPPLHRGCSCFISSD